MTYPIIKKKVDEEKYSKREVVPNGKFADRTYQLPKKEGILQPTGINDINDMAGYLRARERQNKYGMASRPALNQNTNNKQVNTQEGYQSPYSSQIQGILDSITNQQPFSYNMNTDPLYQQYSQQYQRQGDMAMRDTMGNAAALTGGYGSSYGTVAGSQAYDASLQQLNDRVPELAQLAYEKYQNGLNNQYNQLSALQSLDESGYNRYADNRNYDYQVGRDKVSDNQWQQSYDRGVLESDRSYNYQAGRDKVNDKQWQQTFDYGKSRDSVSDNQWQQTFDYGKSRDTVADQQWQNEYNRNINNDKQAQKNWQSETDYDKYIDQRNYDYQVQQDALDRQAAIDDYLANVAEDQSATAAKESANRIDKYTNSVDKMLSQTTTDELGNAVSKYSVDDVWDYLSNSDLTDDEIAIIVNGNYELRKYAESQMNTSSSSKAPHSVSRGNF